MKSTIVNLSNYLRENINSSIDNDLLEKSGKEDLSAVKINLTEKDFNKVKASDEEGEFEDTPLQLHEYQYKDKPIEYYDERGNVYRDKPFISEFYASSRQNRIGGYSIYFDKADEIGSFRTLKEAIAALNNWINKLRILGHSKPKWIYNASKGDYQMTYSIEVPTKLDESTSTSANKLKSILSSNDDVYDEEKRESSWGVWYRSVQKYIEDVANELGKEIGIPFKKNFYGDIEARLGEYGSKDGGSRVEVILDFDSGLQTFVDHSMAQSVKRTRKGGMVMRINYPGQSGSCKTIVLTGADDTKLMNIINALKDINKVKIKDLEKVQGYDSEQKTYKLLVKTLKKYNIY